MPIDWSLFVDFVRRSQHFLLTTHVRPDGDGLGSMLALAEALRQQGKTVQMTVASALPSRYDFMDPGKTVRRFQPPGNEFSEANAAIVLDTGTWNQLGDFGTFLQTLAIPKAVIDHHLTQDDLGAIRLVDTTAEATGRLVYEATLALGKPLTREAAQHLFIALAMDTGWFRHNNTNQATFALASALVHDGAEPTKAYTNLYEQSNLGRLKLTGLVLQRLQVTHEGRTAFTEVRLGDYEACSATPQDTEDLINYTRSMAGVEVGLFFMEQPRGGVKVSFRSQSRVDVARLAEQFGGGGHRLASGAILETNLEEARNRVLDAVALTLASLP